MLVIICVNAGGSPVIPFMYVLTAEEMRAADAHAIHNAGILSLTLMENAASAVAGIILRRNPEARRVLVVCGKGNNGGDGLAVARLLKNAGWNPTILLIGQSGELKSDPSENWARAISSNVLCVEDPDGSRLEDLLGDCDLVIDALFGTGLTKPLEGVYSSTIQKINHTGKEVVSIDVPSGLSSDTGSLIGPAIKARSTVSLAALKYCHLLAPASKMCGEIFVADIGISAKSTTSVVRSQDIRRILPHRPLDSHKGTYGHAVIVGGSMGKTGAAYLSGKSALRCGSGLVTIACPSVVQPIIAGYGPEIMTVPVDDPSDLNLFLADKTAVAIGPGMGIASHAKQPFSNSDIRIQRACCGGCGRVESSCRGTCVAGTTEKIQHNFDASSGRDGETDEYGFASRAEGPHEHGERACNVERGNRCVERLSNDRGSAGL